MNVTLTGSDCAGLCTEAGLTAAYRRYGPRLLARARLVVVDPDLAEEAVQEAFVRAWRNCASFDPGAGPLVHWLLVITRNAAIDLARARGRRPPVVAVEAGRDVASSGDLADLVATRSALSQALLRLAPQHRHAIVETILRDRPPKDVAAEIGVPAGTLRSRLHYGLRQLHDLLDVADAA
jgi:RNA polymerase sigma-70 factor, ECF subfamily